VQCLHVLDDRRKMMHSLSLDSSQLGQSVFNGGTVVTFKVRSRIESAFSVLIDTFIK
jgi:hypothetical protein